MSTVDPSIVLSLAKIRKKSRDAAKTLRHAVDEARACASVALSTRQASAALRYALAAAAAAKSTALSPNSTTTLSLRLSVNNEDFGEMVAAPSVAGEDSAARHRRLLDVLSSEARARSAAARRCTETEQALVAKEAQVTAAQGAGRRLAGHLATLLHSARPLRAAARAAGLSSTTEVDTLRQVHQLPVPLYLVFARARVYARSCSTPVSVSVPAGERGTAVVVGWPSFGDRVRFTLTDGSLFVEARPDVPLGRLFSSLPGQAAAQDEEQPYSWAAILGGDELALRELRNASATAIFAALGARFRVRAALAAQWTQLEQQGVLQQHSRQSVTDHRATIANIPVLIVVPVDYPVQLPTLTLVQASEVGQLARTAALAAVPQPDVTADGTAVLRTMLLAFADAAAVHADHGPAFATS
eukprot:CAMPEP_0170749178 /NCGR_PEP_ID=MMETSP0437-20130122/10259_1 /TAXON_ID=0 /ORGANISM="Sexangularia sp." /LENGTH=413 /DNA_ID=CAMNT_0011088089 /DNA_START=43 /DNA_END=1284 /DNA_ORIENTATION=+